MTEYSPSTPPTQETFGAEVPPILGTVNIHLRPEHFAGTAWPPDPGPDGNGGTAYLSPAELRRHNGHDRRVDNARAVRIEDELGRRGIGLRGRGADRCGPCPVCDGTDRFSINIKKQVWNCRGCATGGDVIALVQHIDGCDFMEAVETLAPAAVPNGDGRAGEDKREIALSIWRKAADPHGTLVEQYLKSRALELPGAAGEVIRFHPSCSFGREHHPAMICLVRNATTNAAQAIHRTALATDGTAIKRNGKTYRLSLGPISGGAIKLDPDVDATRGLCIGEGVETCLSGAQMGFRPVWSVLSTAGISAFPVLQAVERLHIFAENDAGASAKAVAACARRWHEAGRDVFVATPGPASKDLNDELQHGGAGLRSEKYALDVASEACPDAIRRAADDPANDIPFEDPHLSTRNLNRDQEKAPSRVIGAGTFMRSYVPISYTIGGILPSGYLYGLTAKQGSGKTAKMIAASLAVGFGRDDILGCIVESGRVAYVTIENPVDFKMKLAVNCFVHNISYDEIETRVSIIDGRDTPEQIFAGLKLDARAKGDFQLVCFDTFQAGFAAANAGAFNDNEAVLKYVSRLRQLTLLPGFPSVLVAFHPTKNAGEAELIPYGGGSTLNEVDGNLTLWKEGTIKLYHNRLRGPEFEPRFFRIEQLSCPDIVDKGGRQILLPVLRPTTEKDVEERARVSRDTKLELLRAMLAEPKGTQRDWAMKINLSVSTVNEKLKILEGEKLVKKILDAWFLTPKGENLANG